MVDRAVLIGLKGICFMGILYYRHGVRSVTSVLNNVLFQKAASG
jgi:hypothetical protein